MRWFMRQYPGVTMGEFYKLCRGGQVRVNSSRCRGQEILYAGDVVRVPPTLPKRDAHNIKREGGSKFSLADLEELRKTIIHDDEDIVAFNKPAGLAVQGGTGIKKSVDKMAAALFPYDKVSLVHRLDRETSGVLIVAKNQRAAQDLARQFQGRTASKEYLALLSGNISPKSGVIDNMLGASDTDIGKRAITKYKVLGELPGMMSWVSFSPQTGRTHQLRLHSAFALNAPIVGDALYGKSGGHAFDALVATNRLFLFAHRISFRHPGAGKMITLRAEMPDFMKPVLKLLEFKIPE
jgi:23S rRNA pseudouridine955/2504/2580 synthase